MGTRESDDSVDELTSSRRLEEEESFRCDNSFGESILPPPFPLAVWLVSGEKRERFKYL
jgi:hypothetical protein